MSLAYAINDLFPIKKESSLALKLKGEKDSIMKSQKISLALSILLSSSQVFAIDISYQSHISPSPIALDALRHRGGNAPRLTQANNAVPIVEIADANKAGISNNYFTDFNVGVEGLIFNNSKDLFVNTTLAGYIQGNSNLTQEASLILNQVTGSNPSSLLGVMEIAGKRADLIIANPNGITCKACGVLNAQSFTLSTGVISQAEIERVANSQDIRKTLTMMTERGHINIEALNASNVAKLNLIAKSVSVKGNLLAQDLQLILGKNKVFFDVNKQSDASLLLYETITTRGEGGEEQKALALDVAHLGSVVAKSIYLVATEEGVGVRNSGSMATIGSKEEGDGGFVIDVNGIVTLSTPQNNKSTLDKDGTSPSLISSSDLRIRAKELHNGSIISANNDISITADKVENKSRYEIKDVVVNYDETSWKVNMNINKIVVKTWTVEERIHNFSPAIIQSGGNLTIKATNITNDMGHLTAGANAVFDTKEKFENKAPELKTKIYKQEYKQYGITGKKEMRFEGLENQWYSKNNLPHYNTKDLILSTQSFILTQALEKIGEFNYTQENRKEYTDLSSFLSSSSFQEYLQSNSLHPTLITQELKNTYEQDKLKEQEREARESLQTLLEQRLQAVKKDKESLDPNEFSSIGVNAKSVKIEAGEIINTSLIEAGYTTIIGDSVLNKNGIIVSREDLNIQAKDFKNFGADLIAGNDLTIKADKVEIGTRETYTDYLGGSQHTVSNIKGGNNITISSNTDAKFTSVNMEANNNLSISAKNNVIFDTAQNISVTQTSSTKTKLGWFKVTKTTTTTTSTTKTNISNSLKGNNISISAGKDLTGYNIKAEAKEKLAMNAGGDLLLSTKADTTHRVEEKREETTGIFTHNEKTPIRHNVGISIGSITTNTTTNTNTATHNNQTLSANKISLTSGNQTKLESINTDSKNISISGKDVTITALSDSYDQTIHQESTQKTFGIGASVNTNAWGVNVGMGYEERKTTYDKEYEKTTSSSANISANKISITTANKQGNPRGDINIIGSNLNGGEINLTGKDVSIKNHQTINKVTENTSTKIDRVGFQVGLGGGGLVTIGGYGSGGNKFDTLFPMNMDENISFSHSTINTGSNLVGNNIAITSEKNTNIIGSNIAAKNETNITASNINIKGSQDVHIKGEIDMKYDVTAGSNLSSLFFPTVADIEAYAKANANASLDTKVNNSSISSNTINVTANKNDQDGGNITIAGGNLEGDQVNITADNNLEIKTQTELHASINGDAFAKAESIGSAFLTTPIKVNGKLGANVSTGSAEQSGIKSQSTQIKVGNQTKLTGAYISAKEKSSIKTKTIKASSLLHLEVGTNQEVGIGGNVNILGGLMAGGLALADFIFKTNFLKQPETIGNLLFAEGTLGGGKWLNGATIVTPKTHSSSVSKPIKIKTDKPLGGILAPRGEPREEKKIDDITITNEELFGILNVLKKDKK